MLTKICSKCNIEKDLNLFIKRRNICKTCINEYKKNYYSENSEKIKAENKKYYSENKEKCKKLAMCWKTKNPDKVKESKLKNITELKDGYIKHLIASSLKCSTSMVIYDPDLFELKRTEIRSKRKIRKESLLPIKK